MAEELTEDERRAIEDYISRRGVTKIERGVSAGEVVYSFWTRNPQKKRRLNSAKDCAISERVKARLEASDALSRRAHEKGEDHRPDWRIPVDELLK